MFLTRSLLGSSLLKAPQLPQRRMSDQRLPNQRRAVPVEVQERTSTTTDLKRPPFLLVKSFCNLRHRDTNYGEDVSRVTDELSFQPHRTIFIEILQLPQQRQLGTDSYAEIMLRETALPDTKPDPFPVPAPES